MFEPKALKQRRGNYDVRYRGRQFANWPYIGGVLEPACFSPWVREVIRRQSSSECDANLAVDSPIETDPDEPQYGSNLDQTENYSFVYKASNWLAQVNPHSEPAAE